MSSLLSNPRYQTSLVVLVTGGVLLAVLFLAQEMEMSGLGLGAGCLTLLTALPLFTGRSDLDQQARDRVSARAMANEAGSSPHFRAALINALQEPALFITPTSRIGIANGAARKVFRFVDEEPLLKSVIRRPELLEAVEAVQLKQEPRAFSLIVLDDPDRHFSGWVEPVEVEDGDGLLITMHDTTEIKRVGQARADFLANAGHELRTPLTSIAGFVETMRGAAKDDTESWDGFLKIMHGETQRMSRLINDLMSLTRIEQKEHLRPNSDTDLCSVVMGVTQTLRALAEEKGVTIKLEGDTGNVMVRGEADELSQVALNLIDNALKYSEQGQVIRVHVAGDLTRDEAITLAGRGIDGADRLTISSSAGPSAASYAALRVEDSGPGIEGKYLSRLSERFFRVDQGRGLRRGTGLGLAIVKHVLSRHRGDFVVESLLGHGSAFGVLLPMSNASPPLATQPTDVI